MNTSALMLAIHNLAIEYKCTDEDLALDIWRVAYSQIKDLTPDEINQAVADLETKHRPFEQPGVVIIDALKLYNQRKKQQ